MNINITLFGQAITFAIFVWFTMTFVWPLIFNAMEERQAKIAEGLAAGRRGEEALDKAKADAATVLQEAKTKASEIIEQGNRRATQLVDEAKDHAREEGQRILTAARAEIEQEASQAREQLRQEVVDIAVLGAEKILEKSVDKNAHAELLNKLAANM